MKGLFDITGSSYDPNEVQAPNSFNSASPREKLKAKLLAKTNGVPLLDTTFERGKYNPNIQRQQEAKAPPPPDPLIPADPEEPEPIGWENENGVPLLDTTFERGKYNPNIRRQQEAQARVADASVQRQFDTATGVPAPVPPTEEDYPLAKVRESLSGLISTPTGSNVPRGGPRPTSAREAMQYSPEIPDAQVPERVKKVGERVSKLLPENNPKYKKDVQEAKVAADEAAKKELEAQQKVELAQAQAADNKAKARKLAEEAAAAKPAPAPAPAPVPAANTPQPQPVSNSSSDFWTGAANALKGGAGAFTGGGYDAERKIWRGPGSDWVHRKQTATEELGVDLDPEVLAERYNIPIENARTLSESARKGNKTAALLVRQALTDESERKENIRIGDYEVLQSPSTQKVGYVRDLKTGETRTVTMAEMQQLGKEKQPGAPKTPSISEATAVGQLDKVLDYHDEVESGTISSWFGAGDNILGTAAAVVSGSAPKAKLESMLEPIKGLVTKDSMEELRAASPTGATGLGQITAPELKMLQSLQGDLSSNTDPELLRETLVRIRDFRAYIAATEYDPTVNTEAAFAEWRKVNGYDAKKASKSGGGGVTWKRVGG